MRSGLSELVGKKPQFRTDFALTLLPRLRIKLQAIEERCTRSLYHLASLSIDRAGDSLDFSFILHLVSQACKQGSCSRRWLIRVLTTFSVTSSHIRCELIHSRPFPISLEMDHQFPPEIIQVIVEASLDAYDPFAFDEHDTRSRYSTLKRYSLLNSTWRAVSEPLLYRWVVIQSEVAALLFAEIAEDGKGMIEQVRDVYIELHQMSTLAKILNVVTRVENLTLCMCTLDAEDLKQLQQLRRLELIQVDICSSSATTYSLPSLRHLKIFHSFVSCDFLDPLVLPQLRHLEVNGTRGPVSVEPLLPQLEALSHSSFHSHSLVDALAGARSLRLLHQPDGSPIDHLSEYPSLPPFLSVKYWSWVAEAPGGLEKFIAATKKGVRVILLRERLIDDKVKSFVERLEAFGVRVVLESRDPNFAGAILAMERILAEEKRATEKMAAEGR